MKADLRRAIHVSVLASSSKANVTVFDAGDSRILIDCGLSFREVGRRLKQVGLDLDAIDAIVLTHEHSDHIRGLPRFLNNRKVPVFMTEGTWQEVQPSLGRAAGQCSVVGVDEWFTFGRFELFPFAVQHDAREPVGFLVRAGGVSIGIATDLGCVTDKIKGYLEGLDGLIIESNHDPELLRHAPYPWVLKRRIESAYGHLSNQQAGELLEHLSLRDYVRLQVVVAAHVSENSNCPELAIETLREHWNRSCRGYQPTFAAANAKEPTPLFEIANVQRQPAAAANNGETG